MCTSAPELECTVAADIGEVVIIELVELAQPAKAKTAAAMPRFRFLSHEFGFGRLMLAAARGTSALKRACAVTTAAALRRGVGDARRIGSN